MSMAQKIGFLIAGVVLALAGYWFAGRGSQTLETLVQNAASRQLDRSVAVNIDLRNTVDEWTLVCGTITEADGAELKIASTDGEAAYESDRFCALAAARGADHLTEFDFGSTDMPAMDWLDRHGVMPDIFMSGDR